MKRPTRLRSEPHQAADAGCREHEPSLCELSAGVVSFVNDHQIPWSRGYELCVRIEASELERADHIRLDPPRVLVEVVRPDSRDLRRVVEQEVFVELRAQLEHPL